MSNLSANESNVDLLRFFKALADETRLKMAALLASKPRSGEQLAELLSIKAATVSHHLSKLADAELVTSTTVLEEPVVSWGSRFVIWPTCTVTDFARYASKPFAAIDTV